MLRPVALLTLLLVSAPAAAQSSDGLLYQVELEKDRAGKDSIQQVARDNALHIRVQFKVRRLGSDTPVTDIPRQEIFLYEDDKPVEDFDLYQPSVGDALTAVLALDISGSMKENGKLQKAQDAAKLFLQRLPDKADVGLILFDHEMRLKEPPAGRGPDLQAHRAKLRGQIEAARPLGGTAYLDATVEGLRMLDGVQGRKAVVVMTDGVDLNSARTLPQVIELAQKALVPVYTIGVGEPGKNDPVATVLALDRSGSMMQPAAPGDAKPKIKALHEAAARFADLMRPNARTSLLAFSSQSDLPTPFTSDKSWIKKRIGDMVAGGETALFDAAYDALMTLQADAAEAARRGESPGKRAVVVLTDGIDNRSRRRVEEVVRLANELQAPLYLLGLGREGELDEKTMRHMAEATRGKYYPVRNQQQLLEAFEGLSIQLHDDGIDEQALRQLAEETGGKYYLARDLDKLELYFQEIAAELDTTYTATFRSRRPPDGTVRRIDIILRRDGKEISQKAKGTTVVHGLVLAEMHPGVYLGVLGCLGGLLLVPAGLRRLHRAFGGT